jgi:nicotinamidase-related amidase
MQRDFCAPGGWVDQLGEDIANLRAAVAPVARLMDAARKAGLWIVHTREGHRPDLVDLNPNKQWRTRQHGLGIGDQGAQGRILVRGQTGHDIVPECAPLDGEIIVDKPGKGGFFATGLERRLRARGIENLIVCGVTSDCCVQSTFRDAGELGFDPLLVVTATSAVDPDHHAGMMSILSAFGGRWGATADLDAAITGLKALD